MAELEKDLGLEKLGGYLQEGEVFLAVTLTDDALKTHNMPPVDPDEVVYSQEHKAQMFAQAGFEGVRIIPFAYDKQGNVISGYSTIVGKPPTKKGE